MLEADSGLHGNGNAVVMRMSLKSLVELGLYRLYPPPVPTCVA